MKEVTSMQDHVNVVLLCEAHDLVESLPTVIFAFSIAFIVSYMTIGGYKNSDSIGACTWA